MAEVYRRIALALGAEYTLGYYPAEGPRGRDGGSCVWICAPARAVRRGGASHAPRGLLRSRRALAFGRARIKSAAEDPGCTYRRMAQTMVLRKRYRLRLPSRTLALGQRTLIMGVLNVTPDSFSDGGRYLDSPSAIARALELERAGADMIDIGGESTRPGADPVSAEEELARVLPVLEGLARARFESPFRWTRKRPPLPKRALPPEWR